MFALLIRMLLEFISGAGPMYAAVSAAIDNSPSALPFSFGSSLIARP